jgi:hypothetical protein
MQAGSLLLAGSLGKAGDEAHNVQGRGVASYRRLTGRFNLNSEAGMRTIKRMPTVAVLGFLSWVLAEFAAPVQGQAIGFQPIPAPLPSGVMLEATPSVSADRRYVRMGLNVGFNDLLGFTTYSVPAAVGGGGAAGMNGLIGGVAGAGGAAAGAGGIGGGVGLRSEGLGGPVAGANLPFSDFAPPAGDPFQQALVASPTIHPAKPSIAARLDKPSFRTRDAQARLERSPRRDTARTAKSSRTRKRYATSGTAQPYDLMRDNHADMFPLEP